MINTAADIHIDKCLILISQSYKLITVCTPLQLPLTTHPRPPLPIEHTPLI